MSEELKVYEEKMEKSIDALLNEYASIRAGRANPHVLDKIKVDYYGTPTPIQQVGNISVSGSENDPDPAVGEEPDPSDRESDPDFRAWNQPEQRRNSDPPCIPGAHRG